MVSKDPHRYDNLIDNIKPITQKPMAAIKRAAQFAPFAALTGYDGQVKETARITEAVIELAGDEITILDRQLRFLQEHLTEHPKIEITYFVPDTESHKSSIKDGGSYITHTGTIKRIDTFKRKIVFYDTCTIPIDRIADIDGEIFVDEYCDD